LPGVLGRARAAAFASPAPAAFTTAGRGWAGLGSRRLWRRMPHRRKSAIQPRPDLPMKCRAIWCPSGQY